jgi:hypothetical protein
MREVRIIAALAIKVLAALSAAGQPNSSSPIYLALEAYPDKSKAPRLVETKLRSEAWLARSLKVLIHSSINRAHATLHT